jgi:hypothetical protein
MSKFEKSFSKFISFTRNKVSLNLFNFITNNENAILIMPNLYLGNINVSKDIDFLKDNHIDAIVNCSYEIEFHEYFNDKEKIRLSVHDDKSLENMKKFQENILGSVEFIDKQINNNKIVLVHCYYGLMRSATVIAAYLIIKYNMPVNDAIIFLKKKNKIIFNNNYNFIEILENIYNIYKK